MSQYCSFNVNNCLFVKLRPEGYALWKAHFNFMPDRYQKPIEWYESKADESGFCKFQLWEFMQIFGPHMALGMQTVFDTQVYFRASELKVAPSLPAALPNQ